MTKALAHLCKGCASLSTDLAAPAFAVSSAFHWYFCPHALLQSRQPLSTITCHSIFVRYFIDYLASMQKLDKGAHGYAGFFVNR